MGGQLRSVQHGMPERKIRQIVQQKQLTQTPEAFLGGALPWELCKDTPPIQYNKKALNCECAYKTINIRTAR